MEERVASLFRVEDEINTFPRKVGNNLPDYMASHPRRQLSSYYFP
jgi:hypothetical protein